MTRRLTCLLLLILAACTPAPPATPAPSTGEPLDIAVYIGDGTAADKIMPLMRALAAPGHRLYGLTGDDLALGRLTTADFDLLVLGAGEGGSDRAYSHAAALGSAVVAAHIRAFVEGGGGLVALEQGAHLLAGDAGLGLYAGEYVTTGSAGKQFITIVDAAFGSGQQEAYRSDGGGYLTPVNDALVIAEDEAGNPVIVRTTYGAGRVVLATFDLELRGDEVLDWAIWDNLEMGGEHTNSQGCWSLLARLVNWAAGRDASTTTLTDAPADEGAVPVAVVSTHTADGGAWPGLLPGVYRSIEHAGYTPMAIRFDEIDAGRLTPADFATVVFPGGYAYGYRQGIGNTAAILDYVAGGGGYYGICAGSYFASREIEWEGLRYNYLPLFAGQDRGPLAGTTYPDYELLTVHVEDPVIGDLGDIGMLYYGGGWKDELDRAGAAAVATYKYDGADSGKPAAVRFTYGKGRVLLVGTHPEARPGSNEDWMYWDGWLPGSTMPLVGQGDPWAFVDAAFDNWLVRP